MSNSMKLINFIFSLLIFLIVSIVFNILLGIFPSVRNGIGLLPIITGHMNIMISTLLLILSQAIFRLKYTQKQMNKLGHYNVIEEYPITPFRRIDRLIIYVFPAIPVIFPFFKGETINKYSISGIVMLIIYIIITEILFNIFNKTMKVVVTDKGVAVTGYDLRLELPISANYPNPSGFYPFERIEGFRYMKKEVILYQSYDLGAIIIKASEDDTRRIRGLLLQNHVPESKIGSAKQDR